MYFLPSVVEKVKISQRKAVAELSDFVTVSDETSALLWIANTYDKVVFKYFKEQPDVLNWDGNMPSPPNVIKSKYTDKRADKASQSCKDGPLRDGLFLIGGAMILPLQDLPRTVMI
jgi:hypothetical protein